MFHRLSRRLGPARLRAFAAMAALAVAAPLVVLAGAAPASAAAPIVTRDCAHGPVTRCIELRYDRANNRIRVYADIWDNGEYASDFNVDLISVDGAYDGEGPNDVVDTGNGPLRPCAFGPITYTAEATYRYRNVNSSTPVEGRISLPVYTCY